MTEYNKYDYTKTALINIYLEWMNNYLTVKRMASDYGISEDSMLALIDAGRMSHEMNVQSYKNTGKLIWRV